MSDYAEISDQFERLLKLETPPVAIKFIKEGEEAPNPSLIYLGTPVRA